MKNKFHRKTFRFGVLACLALLFIPVLFCCGMLSPTELAIGGGMIGMITMTDLAKMNSGDAVREIVEDSAAKIPEWGLFPAEQLGVGELTYESLIRSGYPTADFLDMGGGMTSSKSTTRMERFETFRFGGRIDAPTDIADNYKRGGAAGYFAFEAVGIAKAAMFRIAQQIYYGRAINGKGFPGLRNFTAYGTSFVDPLTGKTYPLAINAGGTTANGASSVYLIKFATSPEALDGVDVKFGTGSVFDLPDPTVRWKVDPNDSTKEIQVYTSDLKGFAGLCTPIAHCVRRIFNLTDESGKGCTDALLAVALKSFPQGMKPDVIIMSPNQRYHLQISRTVTLMGQGSTRPNQPTVAPIPTEYDNVPIIASDAIGDADIIETQALAEE